MDRVNLVMRNSRKCVRCLGAQKCIVEMTLDTIVSSTEESVCATRISLSITEGRIPRHRESACVERTVLSIRTGAKLH